MSKVYGGMSRWRKHSCFFILVGVVAMLTYIQWVCLYTQRGRIFISRIQHFGEVIVPGWEPNTNLQTAAYLRPKENTTLLVGKNVCPADQTPTVLIVVCSKLENYDLRLAIRSTWGRETYPKYNVNVVFLVGTSSDHKPSTNIQNENATHNDIIVEDFVDGDENVTLKSAFMLKWVSRNCNKAKFLLKLEDDVFVNIGNVIKFVNDPTRVRPRLLVGKLVPNETVVRDSMRDRYMPRYMYPHESYPDYLAGAGYLMSMDTVELLYQKALITSYVYLEDVFITGLCAEAADVTRYYDFRFYYIEGADSKLDCSILFQQNLIIHSHKINSVRMYEDYDIMKRCIHEKP